MNLDKAFLERIRPAVTKTWYQIGSDVEMASQEAGERLTNAVALEMVCDADRIAMHGDDPEANTLVLTAFKEHGYDKVMKVLKKEFKLA